MEQVIQNDQGATDPERGLKRRAPLALWLNSGVPAAEVARSAGHGVAVLLNVQGWLTWRRRLASRVSMLAARMIGDLLSQPSRAD